MHELNTEVVVIGSGSAGLTTAIGLVKVGYKVIVIEKELIGGDCTHFGCVPSKALLSRAKNFYEFKQYSSNLNIKLDNLTLKHEADKVLAETRKVVWEFANHETVDWLENYGIEVIGGDAEFVDKNTIKVHKINLENTSKSLNLSKDVVIHFKKAVICTGSSTFIPPITGLEDENIDYLTNKNIFSLTEIPESLTIIGNGPIGVELSEAFLHLGTKVSLIGNSTNILPRSEADLASKIQDKLVKIGLNYIAKTTNKIEYKNNQYLITFQDGTSIKSEKLLIATGRKPNLPKGLNEVGIEYTEHGIKCNKHGVTSNKHVFVAGDIALGYPNFTHYAGHMGGVITTNLAIEKYTKLPLKISKFKLNAVPAITFTSPELAECGLTEIEAINIFGEKKIKSYTFNFTDLDRAKAQGHEEGYIKIITKGFFGKIIGVHILASRGGEILPELQRLVQKQSSLFSLSKIIRAYPSYTANLDSLFKQWIIEKISNKNL